MINQFQYDQLTGIYSKEYFYQRVREFLRQNPELAEEIAAQVMANADKLLNSKIGRKSAPAPAAKPAEEAAPAPAEAPAAPKANIDIEVDD